MRFLQEIEDFYKNQGYSGDGLRKILEKDEEWRKLVNERKRKLRRRFPITEFEEKKYVMSTDEDFEIISKVKQLEKLNLKKEDKTLVKLIRTQLEHDWRKPVIRTLNRMLQKYSDK